MKRTVLPLAVMMTVAASVELPAQTLYWDSNGATAGAGATPTGTWGTSAFWSTDSTGLSATGAWIAGRPAVFSAGTDATGAWTLDVTGTQAASSVLVEEGIITLNSGTVDTGASTFTIGTGAGSTARVNIATSTRLNSAGKVVLDGGTLFSTNTGNAGSFINAAKGLEITANGGTVGYDDGSGVNAFTTIYSGTITGTGGTTTAGVGTLTKIGPDEFRVQGANVANYTFQKLNVLEGLYRIGSASTPTGATGENGFGADPSVLLPDAITLNGGAIGTSLTLTLNTNRGITLGASGGTINITAASLNIPSPITGSGNLTLRRDSGSAVLNLSGNSDYTGTTFVPVGRIDADSANALGSVTGDTRISAGAEVRYDGVENNYTTAEPFQIAGGGAGGGGAITVQNSSNVTFSGPITLTADATVTVSGTGTVSYNNANAFTSLANQNLTLQGGGISTGGGGTISGVIALGTGGLTKLQGGRWVLSAANTYDGATSISAGTLVAASNAALGSTSGSTTVTSGAALGFQGNTNYSSAEAVSIAGTGILSTGAINNIAGTNSFAGPITMTADSSVGVTADSLTLSGGIGGASNLTKVGTGTLILSGATTYTGSTTIAATTGGTLTAAAPNSLGSTTAITVNTLGTLLLGGANNIDRINNLAAVNLAGGTFNTGGLNEGPAGGASGALAAMGALTLSLNSTIDFTSGTGSNLLFASLLYTAGDAVSIRNWTGMVNSDDGSPINDRLLFIGAPGFTAAQLASIQFYNDSGVAFDPGANLILFNGYSELVPVAPVPEPSAVFGALALLGLAGYSKRRRAAVPRRALR